MNNLPDLSYELDVLRRIQLPLVLHLCILYYTQEMANKIYIYLYLLDLVIGVMYAPCGELSSIHGNTIKCRYFGVYFINGRILAIYAKKASFFGVFNAASLVKLVRTASEDKAISSLRFKCLPVLLYAEAYPLLVCDQRYFKFTATRVFIKTFHIGLSASLASAILTFYTLTN